MYLCLIVLLHSISGLSHKDIKESSRLVFTGSGGEKMVVNRSEFIMNFRGGLMLHRLVRENIGNYSSGIECGKGLDEFHKIFLCFFPPGQGGFSVENLDERSFWRGVVGDNGDNGDKSRREGIRFMAILMALSQGKGLEEKDYVATNNEIKIKLGGVGVKLVEREEESINKIREVVEYCRKWESREAVGNDIGKLLTSCELLFQMFLHMFLRDIGELELFLDTFFNIMKNDEHLLERYFVPVESQPPTEKPSVLVRLFRRMTGRSEEPYSVDMVVDEMVELSEMLPFTRMNQPPYGGTLEAYSRGEDRLLGETFDGSMEMSVFEFVCLLLWNPEKGKYSTSHLENISSRLKRLLSKYGDGLDLTSRTFRKDLAKLLEDLGDKKVGYAKDVSGARNKLDHGLFNLLLVLKNICTPKKLYNTTWMNKERNERNAPSGIDTATARGVEKTPKELSDEDMTFESLRNGVLKVGKAVRSKGKNMRFSSKNLRVKKEGGLWDVCGTLVGSLDATVKNGMKVSAKIEFICEPGYSKVVVANTRFRDVPEEYNRKMNEVLKSDDIYSLLTRRFVDAVLGNEVRIESTQDVLLDGPLLSEDDRRRALNALYYIYRYYSVPGRRESSEDTLRGVSRMMENIIRCSASCNMGVIPESIRKYIFTNNEMLEKFIGLISRRRSRVAALKDAIDNEEKVDYNILKIDYRDERKGQSVTGGYLCKIGDIIKGIVGYDPLDSNISDLIRTIVDTMRTDLVRILEKKNFYDLPIIKVVVLNCATIALYKHFPKNPDVLAIIKHVLDAMKTDEMETLSRNSKISFKIPGFPHLTDAILEEEGGGDIRKDVQEKLFYWCLCYIECEDALKLLSYKTKDSSNIPAEAIYRRLESICSYFANKKHSEYALPTARNLLRSVIKKKGSEEEFKVEEHLLSTINSAASDELPENSGYKECADEVRGLIEEVRMLDLTIDTAVPSISGENPTGQRQ